MVDPVIPVTALPVGPTEAGAIGKAPGTGPAPATAESPAFRALLESLERLARHAEQQPAVHDTDSLNDAVRRADDGFREAMELRRRLEDAFQQRPR